jgi:hypothetical protein
MLEKHDELAPPPLLLEHANTAAAAPAMAPSTQIFFIMDPSS